MSQKRLTVSPAATVTRPNTSSFRMPGGKTEGLFIFSVHLCIETAVTLYLKKKKVNFFQTAFTNIAKLARFLCGSWRRVLLLLGKYLFFL
jgi:hypothetical protein